MFMRAVAGMFNGERRSIGTRQSSNPQRQVIGAKASRPEDRAALRRGEGGDAIGPAGLYGDLWRAALHVPVFKLAQVTIVGVGHGGTEIIAGDGLAIVPLEIEVHAGTKTFGAKQGVVHANDFRALIIHR